MPISDSFSASSYSACAALANAAFTLAFHARLEVETIKCCSSIKVPILAE
jgi:hypothetical protein